MENASFQIRDYLKPGCHAHLVGIGGVSMRPLGLVLRSMGMQISGSDMNASVSTDELISKGIDVAIGHRAENIAGADCVIRTAAANNDNPEIAAARAAGVRIVTGDTKVVERGKGDGVYINTAGAGVVLAEGENAALTVNVPVAFWRYFVLRAGQALALAVLPAAAAVLADLGLFWKGRLLKKRG